MTISIDLGHEGIYSVKFDLRNSEYLMYFKIIASTALYLAATSFAFASSGEKMLRLSAAQSGVMVDAIISVFREVNYTGKMDSVLGRIECTFSGATPSPYVSPSSCKLAIQNGSRPEVYTTKSSLVARNFGLALASFGIPTSNHPSVNNLFIVKAGRISCESMSECYVSYVPL